MVHNDQLDAVKLCKEYDVAVNELQFPIVNGLLFPIDHGFLGINLYVGKFF